MRKLIRVVAVAGVAIGLLGFAGAAQADPAVTVCHSVSVTVNGEAVVDDSACNVLPPQ